MIGKKKVHTSHTTTILPMGAWESHNPSLNWHIWSLDVALGPIEVVTGYIAGGFLCWNVGR